VLVAAAVAWFAAPIAAQEQPRIVRGLQFEGNRSISDATLRASIATTVSGYTARSPLFRWMGIGEKRTFNETEFQRDVLRLQVIYRRSGFPDVVVDTIVRREPKDVWVTFKITEGEPFRLTSLEVTGLDALPDRERRAIVTGLPLREGGPMNVALLQATTDTLRSRLRNRGFPAPDAFREFSADSASRTATAAIALEPGPRMTVGPIRVEGTEAVDPAVVRALLGTQTGRRFSEAEIFGSQANLYRSDLFRLASIVPDTVAMQAGDSAVPLVVRVSESPPYRVRATAGYATNDCFRTSAGVSRRNFLGAGRLLDVSARISKIGVGAPANFGLENTFLCSVLTEDSIGSSKLNYSVNASVRRPAFLSPQTSATLTAFAERRSLFGVYLREDIGTGIAITRESKRYRDPVTLSYTFSYGRTSASPAVFCSLFFACTEELRSLQQQRLPLAILGLRASQSRVDNVVEPGRGTVVLGEVAWSSTLLGSSEFQQFLRLVAEGRWFTTLFKDVVLGTRLRGGMVFNSGVSQFDAPTFVPVDQRFYAGGPNDVRGYNFNQLGPVVYVVPQDSLDAGSIDDNVSAFATGGNTLLVGNAELRIPSPFLAGALRFAAFVDVGSVWQRGDASAGFALRATPGVGIRLQTPVGPFRLDVAYNPYRLQAGTLYAEQENGDLIEVIDPGTGGVKQYQRPGIEGFQFNLTVGQPF
jgi:outer membrane protein insertion porin family/translocation and assembly module TamA